MGSFNSGKYTNPVAKPFPIILLLDTSGSMSMPVSNHDTSSRISELNQAVSDLLETLKKEREFTYSVSAITFGSSIELHTPPTDAQNLIWSPLTPGGMTPLAIALEMAADLIEDRDQIPNRCFKPTIILVSDGAPNGKPWTPAMSRLRTEGRSQHCDRISIGIGEDAFHGPARDVLETFIKDSYFDVVFEAKDSMHLRMIFRQITMSIIEKSKRLSAQVSSSSNRPTAPRSTRPTLQRSSAQSDDDSESSDEE